MRVMFASTQGAGHFTPLVPFIEACSRSGHDVLVVGPPSLDPHGHPFRAGASAPQEKLAPLWARMPSLPPGQGDLVVVGQIYARLNVEAMLPTFHEAIEDWRPDLILREPSEFASAIAAEGHAVRHARIATGLALVDETSLALAAPALEELASGTTGRIAESPYLSACPASLDPSFFEVWRYRDPAAGRSPKPLPDWWPGDHGPLVYVSFGSVAASFPPAAPVYDKALEAVAEVPVRVLLTVGHELDLGQVPANVHVEPWVPQADVLGHAAAVVCHGGSGTTLGALGAGVPLVVVPLFADQPHSAVRVASVGAGVVATLDGIRTALERVLRVDSYRAKAKQIAEEMAALPPPDELLGKLLV